MILLDFRRKGPSPKRARVVVTRGGRQPPVAAASQSGARSKKRASAAREATVIVNQGCPDSTTWCQGTKGNGAGMAATADVIALRERMAKAEGEREPPARPGRRSPSPARPRGGGAAQADRDPDRAAPAVVAAVVQVIGLGGNRRGPVLRTPFRPLTTADGKDRANG